MSVPAYVSGLVPFDYHTETAGTAIVENIPGKNGSRLALLDMRYLCAGTIHTASFMYAKDAAAYPGSSRNSCPAGALAAQKDIVCGVAPKAPDGVAAAASDIIAYQCSDGTWEFNIVTSLAGSTITCTNNLAKAILAGGKVLILGVVTDNQSQRLTMTVSVENKFGEGRLCSILHEFMDEPYVLSIDNATAAGKLNGLLMAYIDK